MIGGRVDGGSLRFGSGPLLQDAGEAGAEDDGVLQALPGVGVGVGSSQLHTTS